MGLKRNGYGAGGVDGTGLGASTANASTAVDDDRIRIAFFREGTRLCVSWKDWPLFGGLGAPAVPAATDVGRDVIGTTNGKAGGGTTSEDHKTWSTALILRSRSIHLLFRNCALESQKTARGVIKEIAILGIGVHRSKELLGWDFGTKGQCRCRKNNCPINLGGVDFDECPALGITLAVNVDADGRRGDNVAKNTALWVLH